ncbi:MAG: FHA domain-containing protein [candidate division KSB1 bacterium]|nr:FHA domain-containing protein [candidate division KSB1 bacterium]MDZ7365392.1 FHA domain-containing protein [candidate division KSB1 bacterium]MDZ7403561.1 FHA domain-containing protein [candidate division KSB1 bacterium]
MSTTSEYRRDGILILDRPVQLPEVLDILIVGGGPAGTGAAFRAKELGLSALVIDYDDLMKQIRDYPKNKKILPNYGVGDTAKFPKCGKLIGLLPFEPIDKDELCERWKGYYREHNVPAIIGLELIDLQRQPDEVWKAKVYNANTKSEQFFLAKHVVLAMGNGAPRPFDIPGNTRDIAYRMADPALYVNAPVLVIGGGTSAAEAVIAISNEKINNNDASAVFWSYRSSKLPKVSKALADEYFAAFVENGNIRTCPNSEPVAVVTAEDRQEYLSIRVDRRIIAGRPNETVHFEFLKKYCLACIGQEIPESFLNKLGIPLMAGGPSGKKRIVVTPLRESRQPNVYLIGSMLGQTYLETEDFNADPATFREKKFGGNIKAAITDGVFVTEVIKQKLAQQAIIQVDLAFYEEDAEQKEISRLMPVAAPMLVEPAPVEAAPAPRAALIRISANDMEVEKFSLNSLGLTTIGRKDCDLSFPNDALLADRHASISSTADGYFLRDDGSHYGVFLKLRAASPLEVSSGDVVQLGKQFLVFRFENENYTVLHYDAAGQLMKRHALEEGTVEMGRAASLVLDGNDAILSRRHLAVTRRAGKVLIQDLNSANGSYIKVRNAVRLEPDDQFRLGQLIFKFVLQQEETKYSVIFKTPPAIAAKPTIEKPAPPAAAKPAPAAEAKDLKPEGMVVVFKNAGKTCPIAKRGQTICDIAEKNGIKIKADCHEGNCGSDPIRILSGAENLNDVGGIEQTTLEEKNNLTPGEYRLACMVKPKGPVVVEILAT